MEVGKEDFLQEAVRGADPRDPQRAPFPREGDELRVYHPCAGAAGARCGGTKLEEYIGINQRPYDSIKQLERRRRRGCGTTMFWLHRREPGIGAHRLIAPSKPIQTMASSALLFQHIDSLEPWWRCADGSVRNGRAAAHILTAALAAQNTWFPQVDHSGALGSIRHPMQRKAGPSRPDWGGAGTDHDEIHHRSRPRSCVDGRKKESRSRFGKVVSRGA